MAYKITSRLKSWPGEFTLPDPDEFNGLHWQSWKDQVNMPRREPYAKTHLYCYAGLELIAKFGSWNIDEVKDGESREMPISEVRSWENSPEQERVKLVSLIGREMMFYMNSIIDPKE